MTDATGAAQGLRARDPLSSAAEYGLLPHVLIVDDEPRIAQSVRDLLSLRSEYRLSVAYGGQDALDKLFASLDTADGPIDLVLLDIDMPLVTGRDVLRRIRETPALETTRVIMLTGLDDRRNMVQALSEGADDYITKPYNINELLARVKTALRTQALEKQLQRQSRQLALLNELSNRITRHFDTRITIEECLRGVREMLQADVACFFAHEQSRNYLRCQFIDAAAGSGLAAETYPPIRIGAGVISAAFTTRITHCVNAIPLDRRFLPGIDAPAGYAVQTAVAAPIFTNGHPIGVLAAMNKRSGSFSENDVDLFVSLAGTLSQAIQNGWLFRNLTVRQGELLASRNTLQALLDGILHPIYTINSAWEVVSINQAQANAKHSPPDQIVGKICYRVFFQRETPCEHCRVPALIADNRPQRWPVRWVGGDYLPREWDVNAFPIDRGSERNTARAVIVWQDRTEERRMETSLYQAAKLSSIGQLAAGVAHEINNPLTVIITGADMLRDALAREPIDEEAQELVGWISSAAQRAGKVVRGLLDFARQSRYEFTAGDVHASLEETLELVAYQLRKWNIEVVREFAPDLPPVTASWEHLKTVWLNLLLNARDALRHRPENRRIRIVTRPTPLQDHILVLFQDNGDGINDEQLSHIFEPFYTTKAPGEGTGLGLATSHRIIDQHGGEISVSSEPGNGATFVIRLPIGEIGRPARGPETLPLPGPDEEP